MVLPSAPPAANELSTWPQWQQQFTQLGLNQDDIAKIGSEQLSDQQLAQRYQQLSALGATSTAETPTTGGATGWDAEWEQRFSALGLPREFVAALATQAQQTGADEAKIQSVYDQLAAQVKGATAPGSTTTPATAPNASSDPAAAQQPGWNAQVEQAFRGLGMPDNVIAIYAQSGAPLSGLEKAYEHAQGRVADFTQRGWMQKFQEAGVPADQTWSLILGPNVATDEQAQQVLDAARKGEQSLWQKGGQLATSLFPGGRLLQYVFGKEFVSGDKIDRTSPMEIGMAALSGLAAFAAIRGGRNVLAGITARNGGYAALNGVSGTLGKLGVSRGSTEAMEQAAMGATQTWGLKQKLLSWIPGTTLHKEVVGLGHAEAAARAFNVGGAAKLLANESDGALKLATLTQVFDDIKSGALHVQGGSNAYLALKKAPLMSLSSLKDGTQVVNVAKGLGIGNGNTQLVGLAQIGGTKLGQNPEWLTSAPSMVDDIARLSQQERGTLGAVLAGSTARDLGSFSKDGFRQLRAITALAARSQPTWYGQLTNAIASEAPASVSASVSAAAGVAPRTVAAAPIRLAADAAGQLRTPSGLLVPGWASSAGAALPTSVDDPSVSRLASVLERMRRT